MIGLLRLVYTLCKIRICMKWPHSYVCFEGNLSTLKTIPESRGIVTRDELLKFHKEFYSANIMSLVVIGKGKNV